MTIFFFWAKWFMSFFFVLELFRMFQCHLMMWTSLEYQMWNVRMQKSVCVVFQVENSILSKWKFIWKHSAAPNFDPAAKIECHFRRRANEFAQSFLTDQTIFSSLFCFLLFRRTFRKFEPILLTNAKDCHFFCSFRNYDYTIIRNCEFFAFALTNANMNERVETIVALCGLKPHWFVNHNEEGFLHRKKERRKTITTRD